MKTSLLIAMFMIVTGSSWAQSSCNTIKNTSLPSASQFESNKSAIQESCKTMMESCNLSLIECKMLEMLAWPYLMETTKEGGDATYGGLLLYYRNNKNKPENERLLQSIQESINIDNLIATTDTWKFVKHRMKEKVMVSSDDNKEYVMLRQYIVSNLNKGLSYSEILANFDQENLRK